MLKAGACSKLDSAGALLLDVSQWCLLQPLPLQVWTTSSISLTQTVPTSLLTGGSDISVNNMNCKVSVN